MPDVIGIDHIYISVSDLPRAEAFYDQVMPILGFRKNAFTIDGDPHIQYFNRHFGYVLRPAKASPRTIHTHRACIICAFASMLRRTWAKRRANCEPRESTRPNPGFTRNMRRIITRPSSTIRMACGWK